VLEASGKRYLGYLKCTPSEYVAATKPRPTRAQGWCLGLRWWGQTLPSLVEEECVRDDTEPFQQRVAAYHSPASSSKTAAQPRSAADTHDRPASLRSAGRKGSSAMEPSRPSKPNKLRVLACVRCCCRAASPKSVLRSCSASKIEGKGRRSRVRHLFLR
jgi:hypothetical protein